MLLEQPRKPSARWYALGSSLVALLLAPGCLVDLDNRCGEHQRFDAELGICACSEDYALVGNQCQACGKHETGSPDGCVCADGFSRPTPGAACQELAGLGQDCQADAECGDPSYGYCYLSATDTAGYCTSTECSTAADCPTDYGCNTRQSPAFCERPAAGTGEFCDASHGCDKAASYCESVAFHACTVNECKADPNKCHGDWVCCDIGLLSQSLCVPPDALEDGNCPAGGTLIPRVEGNP